MTPDVRKMQQLSQLSSQLNAKSDQLNELIVDLENKLSAMNIGLTYWLKDTLCQEIRTMDDRDGQEIQVFDSYDIGYIKIGNGWRIVTREETFVEGPDGEPDYEKVLFCGKPVPLVNASRAVRAEASIRLNNLIDGLIHKVESYISSIDKAAESLN